MGRWTGWSRALRVSVLLLAACLVGTAIFSQTSLEEYAAREKAWREENKLRAAMRTAIQEGNAEEVERLLANVSKVEPHWVGRALVQNQPEIARKIIRAGVDVSRETVGAPLLEQIRALEDLEERMEMYRFFLEQGVRLKVISLDLFQKWIGEGDHELVASVVDSYSREYKVRDKGGCPLILAIERKDLSLLRELLEGGLEKDGLCDKDTPLVYATGHKNLPSLRVLIEAGADLRKLDKAGDAALIKAARYGWMDGVRLLVNSGVDVNQIGETKRGTALLEAAGNSDFEMVRFLIENGANPRLAARDGEMPAAAAFNGYPGDALEIMSYLFDHGASVDDALTAISFRCDFELVRVLLTFGMDPNRPSDNPPIIRLARCGLEILEPLLAAGGDVNSSTSSGETLLMRAVAFDRLELVNRLIELGVDVNTEDLHGQTALFRAAGKKGIALMKALYRAGADLAHEDTQGRNALTIAAANASWGTASFLLRHRVEELPDEEGRTPSELFWKTWSPRKMRVVLDLNDVEIEVDVPQPWSIHKGDPSKTPRLMTGTVTYGYGRNSELEISRTGVDTALEQISPRSLSSDPSAQTFRRAIQGHLVPMVREGAIEPVERGEVKWTMAVPAANDTLLVKARGSAESEAVLLWTLHRIAASILSEPPPNAPSAGRTPRDAEPSAEGSPRFDGRGLLRVLLGMLVVLLGLWWAIRRRQASNTILEG